MTHIDDTELVKASAQLFSAALGYLSLKKLYEEHCKKERTLSTLNQYLTTCTYTCSLSTTPNNYFIAHSFGMEKIVCHQTIVKGRQRRTTGYNHNSGKRISCYACIAISELVVPSAITGQQHLLNMPTLKARSVSATAEKVTKHALNVATSCLLLLV